MPKVPHLVQYQGSKRGLAPEIIRYFPNTINRLIEPFSGTCAVSILTALQQRANSFWLNDINQPLSNLMEMCVQNPLELSKQYEDIWQRQFQDAQNHIHYYYEIRDAFNDGSKDPAKMLFLLARVVKGAIRYNAQGIMNQSCDKRRYGTRPNIIKNNALAISSLLDGKTIFTSLDYKDVLQKAQPGDFIYMDPPYQGTSQKNLAKDSRYIQGIDFDEFIAELEKLNNRGIDFIVSYDGQTGDKVIGKCLPDTLGLTHLYLNAGVSTQATLNGQKAITYESLYLSKNIHL
ncbi:MAG: Dam family site-specific DNA-(adenine-N6)-methyltransferase [bacterium]|nr:Dam family site-specific DNA-(adenine-N6)-methyltransferase [bacterium]